MPLNPRSGRPYMRALKALKARGEVWLCPNCDERDSLIGANVD